MKHEAREREVARSGLSPRGRGGWLALGLPLPVRAAAAPQAPRPCDHPSQLDHVSLGPTSRDMAFSCSVQVDDIPGVLVDPLLVLVEHVNLHCPSGVSQSAAKF